MNSNRSYVLGLMFLRILLSLHMNSQSYVRDNSKAQCKEESLSVEFFERGGTWHMVMTCWDTVFNRYAIGLHLVMNDPNLLLWNKAAREKNMQAVVPSHSYESYDS